MFILSLCLIHIIISLFNFPNYLQKYNLLQNDDELNFIKKELGQNQIKHIFTDRVNILWLKDLDANIYVNKDIEENYELISSDKDKNMVILSNFKSNSYYKKIKKRYNLKLIKVINGKNMDVITDDIYKNYTISNVPKYENSLIIFSILDEKSVN